VDEAVVSQLTEMGFPRGRCVKAIVNTSNSGVDAAMQWLLSHMDDAGNKPI
jgi:ubiquitin carboxyl-terminal hydrolase 5/13